MKNIFVSLICQYNLPIMKELLYLKDDQLKDLIEKLFISYRETFSDSKKILERYSIGLWVMIFLVFFAFITYLLKIEYWRDIK